MRKGSTKSIKVPEPNPPQKPPTTPFQRNLDRVDYALLDILLRICDACHEMQNETEPWASIRKDIERLR
jgi:hypothetical protein